MHIGTGYRGTNFISQNSDVFKTVNERYKGTIVKNSDAKLFGETKIVPNGESRLDYQKEMQDCKEVISNAIAGLPRKGSSLDYRDYALMGIASNMVNSYAKENLTEEQAQVVNKSLQEYFGDLIRAEKESQERNGCFTDNTENVGSTGELNTYYSTRSTLGFSQEQKEDFKRMVAHLPAGTRDRLIANMESANAKGSVVQSASNKDYAETIKSVFQEADLNDHTSVQAALKKYEGLMTPVYKAAGIQNVHGNQALTSVLGQDTDSFLKYISNIKAIIGNGSNWLNVSA